MKTITIEEHIESKIVTEKMAALKQNTVSPNVNPEMQAYMQNDLPKPSQLQDIEQQRLPFMDKFDIDMQILSFGNVSPQNLNPNDAIPLCQLANDELAQTINQHPTRFAGLAVLPVGAPKAAALELERAVTKLGLKGVLLKGNYQNRYFDDPFFRPIFQKASELNVPVYFHPSFVPTNIASQYYEGGQWSDLVSGILASAGFGWHIDVGIQVLRMILSGIFDELPNLKLISGHWGELMPMFLERFDDEFNAYAQLQRPLSSYYRENIYFSPSGILSAPQMQFMLEEVGAGHILYSIDYPYKTPENTGQYLQDLYEQGILNENQLKQISYQNAEKLFNLN